MEGAKVVFICVENAGRSQMAEAFFKRHAPGSLRASSAGTMPAARLNPVVVEAMREVGIELSGAPKALTGEDVLPPAKAVSMGCMGGESCPAFPAGGVEDWGIPDPKGKPLRDVRIIRDAIERKVVELAARLEKQ